MEPHPGADLPQFARQIEEAGAHLAVVGYRLEA